MHICGNRRRWVNRVIYSLLSFSVTISTCRIESIEIFGHTNWNMLTKILSQWDAMWRLSLDIKSISLINSLIQCVPDRAVDYCKNGWFNKCPYMNTEIDGLAFKWLGHFFQNVIHFLMLLTLCAIVLYETGPIQWLFSQDCGYWWPGALAPGHQQSQCWLGTYACPGV